MSNKLDAHRNKWHFEDMYEYACEAVSILAGRSLAELEKDRIAQLALVRCLEVFGEAANRIPIEHRSNYPDVPWKNAVSTRNRLIHGYDTVRLDVVHAILSNELPPLISILNNIVQSFPKPDT
jgi:uncharacterized protein with HEPN domain